VPIELALVTERPAVLALAAARATWGRDLARQATSGTLPIEVVLCLSLDETLARLASQRRWSLLLVDAEHAALDRDLVDRAHQVGCAVVIVGDRAVDLSTLGADRQVAQTINRDDLLAELGSVAPPSAAPLPVSVAVSMGHVVAVVGPGGTGTSTIAIAISQGLADRYGAGEVVLADLRRNAEHAALHGTPDVLPGLPEFVESHRLGDPTAAEIAKLLYRIESRGYDLLLGLRRGRDWAAFRPRAIDAALVGLRRSYPVVVADIDPDVEGHAQCGSIDVEERNHLSRTTLSSAAAVVVVGTGSLKGVLSLTRVIGDLVEFGVSPERVVPLVNTITRRPFERPALASTIRQLCRPTVGADRELGPIAFVPFVSAIENATRDAERLPRPLIEPAIKAVLPLLVGPAGVGVVPEPIRPGSLGHWRSAEVAS
jgi:hypothetical protein